MFCHIKLKSPLDTTAFNPDTEYVIGNQALNGCKNFGINSSGNVPALVVSCIINVKIAMKRPASPNAVTKH